MQFFAPRNTYAQGERPYDVYKDRVSAINSIITAVKDKIANNYWNKLNEVTISELGKKITKDQEASKLNLYGSEPPDNIYPQNLEEVSGQFVDYTVGKMLGKEIMMGRLSPSQEVMMPTMDKQKLLDYAMSGGQMDWTNILKTMEKRPSFLGEYSDLEKTAISGAMGRDVMGELDTGIKRASNILDYLEPKKEKTWEQTLTEANEFIKNNPDYEISAMNPKTGSLSITKKTVKPEINWEKLSEQVEKFGLKLTGMNVNPATGNVSYSFAGQGITWEETLGKANQFIKDNPDYEVTSTNPKTGSVTIGKKGEGTETKTPSIYEAEKIEEGFMEKVENIQDFASELKRLQGLGIDTKTFETTEYFAGLIKKKYQQAMEYVKYAFDKVKDWDSMSEEEQAKDSFTYEQHRENYKMYWEQARNYDQQYFNVTGKHLLESK